LDDLLAGITSLALPYRLLIFIGFAALTHVIVTLIRRVVSHLLSRQYSRRYQKLQSVATITTSALVFSLYFFSVGLVLREFGVSLTTYLASASVVGLAIGFGSQGIVQDVVTGLTFIFSDLVDVGDLVEISGQTGIVRAITMRFVELENAMGASVFIPNRTINNIINYPRGYVRCIVDITLRGDDNTRRATEDIALRLMHIAHEQFAGILIAPPSSEGRIQLKAEKEILRIKFRIWPNRGQPIENAYYQELVAELQKTDPDYQPWMVVISYEVEGKNSGHDTRWSWRTRPKR
jgi:moderate conductance mechanosensitive channel